MLILYGVCAVCICLVYILIETVLIRYYLHDRKFFYQNRTNRFTTPQDMIDFIDKNIKTHKDLAQFIALSSLDTTLEEIIKDYYTVYVKQDDSDLIVYNKYNLKLWTQDSIDKLFESYVTNKFKDYNVSEKLDPNTEPYKLLELNKLRQKIKSLTSRVLKDNDDYVNFNTYIKRKFDIDVNKLDDPFVNYQYPEPRNFVPGVTDLYSVYTPLYIKIMKTIYKCYEEYVLKYLDFRFAFEDCFRIKYYCLDFTERDTNKKCNNFIDRILVVYPRIKPCAQLSNLCSIIKNKCKKYTSMEDISSHPRR